MFPSPHSIFTCTKTAVSVRSADSGLRSVPAEGQLTQYMACRRKRLFGPLSGFLNSRIGVRWSHILAELCASLENEDDYRKVLPELLELTDTHVVNHRGVLRHGTGLLKGQPLQAGWKRRLYVCPDSGRLKRIPGNGLIGSARVRGQFRE